MLWLTPAACTVQMQLHRNAVELTHHHVIMPCTAFRCCNSRCSGLSCHRHVLLLVTLFVNDNLTAIDRFNRHASLLPSRKVFHEYS